MNFNEYLYFVRDNLMFSFTIIFVSFILGWFLYSQIITRGIALKDALFKKDNLAAWVEFIGAFIFPTLYLAAKAIEGSASDDIFKDLGICIAYVAAYIALFTILRLLSGTLVSIITAHDHEGKVSLNNEVYNQRNISASLFSVALSTVFVTMVKYLEMDSDFIYVSLLKMSDILVFTLLAIIFYCIILRHKTALFKEIFVDNNVAAGVSFLGFIFAVETILNNVVFLQREFDFMELAAFSFVCCVLFGILAFVFKWIFTKLISVDIWSEVYEQDNIGAALGQVALYIGVANVIIHFIK